MHFEHPPGATPLDPDECAGLIPLHITLQSELNEWEEINIIKAESWLFSKKSHGDFLSLNFLKRLHKKMFDDTWRWAGKFRSTEKTIDVAPFNITTQIKNLLEDTKYQLLSCPSASTVSHHPIDDIACRFHHRLVAIHPFPNGNGRHARLMTDLLLVQTGRPRFTWGKRKRISIGPVHDQYIAALRKADKQDYTELSAFVRS